MSARPSPLDPTRVTLLARLKDPRDSGAWRELYALYTPLLERFARGMSLAPDEVDDVVGDCLATLARELPTFRHDAARGGFKGWLYTLVRARVVDRLRRRRGVSADDLERHADDEAAPADELWERTWQAEHLRFAVARVEAHVSPRAFEVFQLMLWHGLTAREVAARLGMGENQVYKARARVLAKVRDELGRVGIDAPIPAPSDVRKVSPG